MAARAQRPWQQPSPVASLSAHHLVAYRSYTSRAPRSTASPARDFKIVKGAQSVRLRERSRAPRMRATVDGCTPGPTPTPMLSASPAHPSPRPAQRPAGLPRAPRRAPPPHRWRSARCSLQVKHDRAWVGRGGWVRKQCRRSVVAHRQVAGHRCISFEPGSQAAGKQASAGRRGRGTGGG